MSSRSPQSNARQTASVLLRDARTAGWLRVKCEIKPDGSVMMEVGMNNPESDDDFLENDLRMGK